MPLSGDAINMILSMSLKYSIIFLTVNITVAHNPAALLKAKLPIVKPNILSKFYISLAVQT